MDPSNRKRKTSTEASQPSHKRRQPGRPSQRHNLQRPVNPPKPRSAAEADGEEEVEAVDLVDIDDDEAYGAYQIQRQEEMIKQQRQDEADKPVKLSDFQCIICLDNPTDLTVTWCGHLFCSVCLHEALHAGTQKKTCPVCRQTISTKPGGKTKSGVYVLSMKLMTSKKKGKQPAERA
ncbi:MAG: SUMO-targeted ubiquitin ligase complex subunit slx8 [Claussenomyces sp. TS43310]|nr:MAG: SUMO-targeted ubiquitin ligase complex subunit slx8 [Claussenomyces sp. TS43310]